MLMQKIVDYKENPKRSDCYTGEYRVVYNEYDYHGNKVGEVVFPLEYEEVVEISQAAMLSTDGNECHESAKEKAKYIYDSLPLTDY